MSDISASGAPADAGAAEAAPVTESAPVEAVETEAFDLDAAMDDFATNAPEDWKAKASKLQSEIKNLRSSRNELKTKYEAFDGVHEGDFQAVTQLVTALKSGNTEAAAEWMFEAAKGLTGDQFEAKFGITKAEANQAIAEAGDIEVSEAPELTVAEQIQAALDERENAHKEAVAAQERQTKINTEFSELGYDVTRDANGHLADRRTKMVAQIAVELKGDIKAAHEEYTKWIGDQATEYLKKHSTDQSLAPGQGSPTTAPEPLEGEAEMDAGQKATARATQRFLRSIKGADS